MWSPTVHARWPPESEGWLAPDAKRETASLGEPTPRMSTYQCLHLRPRRAASRDCAHRPPGPGMASLGVSCGASAGLPLRTSPDCRARRTGRSMQCGGVLEVGVVSKPGGPRSVSALRAHHRRAFAPRCHRCRRGGQQEAELVHSRHLPRLCVRARVARERAVARGIVSRAFRIDRIGHARAWVQSPHTERGGACKTSSR